MTWTNQMRMDARFMYEKQGMHVDEIGLKLGKTGASVRMLLVKAGVYKAQTKSSDGIDYQALFNKVYAQVGPAMI